MAHIIYYVLSFLIGFWLGAAFFLWRLHPSSTATNRITGGWTATGTILVAAWGVTNWYLSDEPFSDRAVPVIGCVLIGVVARFVVGASAPTRKPMKILDDAKLERLFQDKQNELLQTGREQASSMDMTVMGEAERLLQACSVLTKPRQPEAYVDLALELLTYPPELAFLIAAQFSELEGRLGYPPFSMIMVAVGDIDNFYSGIYVRSGVAGRAELARVSQDASVRRQRAAEFVARALIMTARSLGSARDIYRNSIIQFSLRSQIDTALKACSSDLADGISI